MDRTSHKDAEIGSMVRRCRCLFVFETRQRSLAFVSKALSQQCIILTLKIPNSFFARGFQLLISMIL